MRAAPLRRRSRRSSIAERASNAEASRSDSRKLWTVIAVIFASILTVYTSSYFIVVHALFKDRLSPYSGLDAAAACEKSLVDSEFDLIDWDRYEEWFDENTELEFPEVGVYRGPDGIREYVQVVVSKYFGFSTRYIYGPDLIPIRTKDKDECTMLFAYGLRGNMSPAYTRGGLVDRGAGGKIVYSADPFRVDKLYIYYSQAYQRNAFESFLNDDRVRDDVCHLMESRCDEVYRMNNLTQPLCREKYDALPMSEDGRDDGIRRLDGNSRGCRIVHAAMAGINAEHCPHLSFAPMEDVNGQIKCQQSGLRSPLDIFTPWEIEKITDAAEEHGLPADTMYVESAYDPKYSSSEIENSSNDDYTLGATNHFFTSDVSNEDYAVFYGFVLWATIVLTGLGLEFFSYILLIKDKWDDRMENGWRLVQFLFPLFATTAFGMAHAGDFWAVPLITLTLYKFSFPETILYLYSGLFNRGMSGANRVKDMIEGVGTVLHHSSGALYFAMVLARVIPSTRSTIEVVIPLLVQHWFVLLRYGYRRVYAIVETALEVWFEWTVISLFEVVSNEHWVAGVITLSFLLSHWLYFISGAIGLACQSGDAEHVDDEIKSLRRLRSVRDLSVFGLLDTSDNSGDGVVDDELLSILNEDARPDSTAGIAHTADSAISIELGSGAPEDPSKRVLFSDDSSSGTQQFECSIDRR